MQATLASTDNQLCLSTRLQHKKLDIREAMFRCLLVKKYKMESEDENWSKVKQQLKIGDMVSGIIETTPAFGYFIDIGVGFPGLLLIPDSIDLMAELYEERYSLIGSTTKAKIIGFNDPSKQVMLTQKPVEEWPRIEVGKRLK